MTDMADEDDPYDENNIEYQMDDDPNSNPNPNINVPQSTTAAGPPTMTVNNNMDPNNSNNNNNNNNSIFENENNYDTNVSYVTVGDPKNQLQVGVRVQILRRKGIGTIRYVGKTHFSEGGILYGIELDNKKGFNDGSKDGQRYFTCKQRYGMFCSVESIEFIVVEKRELRYNFSESDAIPDINNNNNNNDTDLDSQFARNELDPKNLKKQASKTSKKGSKSNQTSMLYILLAIVVIIACVVAIYFLVIKKRASLKKHCCGDEASQNTTATSSSSSKTTTTSEVKRVNEPVQSTTRMPTIAETPETDVPTIAKTISNSNGENKKNVDKTETIRHVANDDNSNDHYDENVQDLEELRKQVRTAHSENELLKGPKPEEHESSVGIHDPTVVDKHKDHIEESDHETKEHEASKEKSNSKTEHHDDEEKVTDPSQKRRLLFDSSGGYQSFVQLFTFALLSVGLAYIVSQSLFLWLNHQ